VQKVLVWTPDKDLGQCVRGERVIQVDRVRKKLLDAAGIREKFGVAPELIPDFLALVGDASDGFPGMSGIGKVGAAELLNRHGPIEKFPAKVLGDRQEEALLFKTLATLRTDAKVFSDVDKLRWKGPKKAFEQWCEKAGTPKLLERAVAAMEKRRG
jgi:5'-3' exonuclease